MSTTISGLDIEQTTLLATDYIALDDTIAGVTKKAALSRIGAGAWTAYTPTVTNFTLGSGTLNGRYKRIGSVCVGNISIVLAADSSMGSSPTFSPPFAAEASQGLVGSVIIGDASGSDRFAAVYYASGLVRILDSSGTYLKKAEISSSAPMTWTTSDTMSINFIFEVA